MYQNDSMELSWLSELLNIPFSKAVDLGIDKCTELLRVSANNNPFDLAYNNTK